MSDTHGRFIWYELTTSDVAAAKAFYGAVVGWTAQDMPMPGMSYTVLEADGRGVGGVMPLTDELRAQGVPQAWTGYIAVDDADAAAAKAASLGGTVVRPAEDIPEVGRFAIIADPAGAVFSIMTPAPMETERPPAPPNALGHGGWHELAGGPAEQSLAFYGALFGWRKDDVFDMGPMGPYLLFANQDGRVGGMMAKPDQMPHAGWLYYFRVAGVDAAAARVTAAGGRVLNGPMEVPSGDWIVQAADPQGTMFALVGPKAG